MLLPTESSMSADHRVPRSGSRSCGQVLGAWGARTVPEPERTPTRKGEKNEEHADEAVEGRGRPGSDGVRLAACHGRAVCGGGHCSSRYEYCAFLHARQYLRASPELGDLRRHVVAPLERYSRSGREDNIGEAGVC